MSASETGGSVERVRAALLAAGHPDTITQFPTGTRTAADAAAAVGCTVAQIAKSIVFRCGMRAAVVITSGANRVDQAKAEAALGVKLGRADADWVRQATGFAIGGVAPVGHLTPPMVLMDEDLLALDPIWAAAGSPSHVFRQRRRSCGGSPVRRRRRCGRESDRASVASPGTMDRRQEAARGESWSGRAGGERWKSRRCRGPRGVRMVYVVAGAVDERPLVQPVEKPARLPP